MSQIDGKITMTTCEGRPCWVNGRRAIFHRWSDSARPVNPYGKDDRSDERLQKWSVHGIVEYEDGTVEREWPSAIQFADSMGRFAEFDWEGMECARDFVAWCQEDEDGQITTQPAAITFPETDTETERCCFTCAHYDDKKEICPDNVLCCECPLTCPCKECRDYGGWEPKGGTA